MSELQMPPFDRPVVVDLTGVRGLRSVEMPMLFDTLRWRLVWSPVVLCVAPQDLDAVEDAGMRSCIPVTTSIGDGVLAAGSDTLLRGPGRRGLAPIGTFGLGCAQVDDALARAIVRVDALRRTRPLRTR